MINFYNTKNIKVINQEQEQKELEKSKKLQILQDIAISKIASLTAEKLVRNLMLSMATGKVINEGIEEEYETEEENAEENKESAEV